MTRINCVAVTRLTNKHLLAEYYELPRVFAYAQRKAAQGWQGEDAPTHYCLGKGHVKFFAIRLGWLSHRMFELGAELRARGINAQRRTILDCDWINFSKLPTWMWLRWQPGQADIELNLARLRERSPGEYA